MQPSTRVKAVGKRRPRSAVCNVAARLNSDSEAERGQSAWRIRVRKREAKHSAADSSIEGRDRPPVSLSLAEAPRASSAIRDAARDFRERVLEHRRV